MSGFPHMPRPCDETRTAGRCPFRIDAEPGEFSAHRFEDLAATAGRPGVEAPVYAPMFSCHHHGEKACAGWLAVCGEFHLNVRTAVARRDLDGRVMAKLAAGVELFDSYDDMAVQQSDGMYDPARAERARVRAGHHLPLAEKLIPGFGGCDIDERGSAGPDTRLDLGTTR